MSTSFAFSRGSLIVRKVRLTHGAARAWARMAVDTGARVTAIAPRIARELGFDPEKVDSSKRIVGASVATSAPLLVVASVSLVGAEVTNLPVVCHPLHPDLHLDGLLGLNFLDHFDVEIRNSAETVTLTRWRE